jgi:hypothetical protein
MNISTQDLLRKIPAAGHERAERATRVPPKNFQDLLRTKAVDEDEEGIDLFTLVEEEEKEAQCPSIPHPCIAPTIEMQLQLQKAEGIDAPAKLEKIALAPGIDTLFEKMASCMIVMNSSHETETTLFLDNPHFASSSFFGTQITIREFTTAPKAFNIEIVSNPQAIALIDASKMEMLLSFQNGHFNFTVHRFDTHIQGNEDRPLFHRKEWDDGQEKDQQGGRDS